MENKTNFKLHQDLRDFFEGSIANYGEVGYKEVLQHFFNIDPQPLNHVIGESTLLSVMDNPTYRRQLYPEVTNLSFRLLYVRLAKKHFCDKKTEVNGVNLDDWYVALFREWSELKRLPHTAEKARRQVRQVVKQLLHFTYPLLYSHNLILAEDVIQIRSTAAKIMSDLIEENRDAYYPIVVSPDGVVFGKKFVWSNLERRRKLEVAELKSDSIPDYLRWDVTEYQAVYPINNKQFILLKDSLDAEGICQVKHCDDYLYQHWQKNLAFWMSLEEPNRTL